MFERLNVFDVLFHSHSFVGCSLVTLALSETKSFSVSPSCPLIVEEIVDMVQIGSSPVVRILPTPVFEDVTLVLFFCVHASCTHGVPGLCVHPGINPHAAHGRRKFKALQCALTRHETACESKVKTTTNQPTNQPTTNQHTTTHNNTQHFGSSRDRLQESRLGRCDCRQGSSTFCSQVPCW